VSQRQDEYAERLTDASKADPNTGKRDVDLEALITGIAESSLNGIPWRIQKNDDYEKPIVHGSRFDLESMFVNILKNAKESIERIPPNKIVPEKHEIVIMIEHTKSADFCRVVVIDTGTGFEDPAIAFNRQISSKRGDHGMGLQSIRDVVEMHHGTVRARNRRDGKRGATIIVKLAINESF
jgi:nitrogen fixation/metabolism regulation signal transduction histidine kinase